MVIDQQLASIGIEVTNAQMKITTPHPSMTISNEAPTMTVERQDPEFKLDWEQVRAESGLKTPARLSRHVRDTGRKQVMDYIAKTAQDGDYLADVTSPGDRVAQLARQHTQQRNTKQINIASMPSSLPKVDWTPGSLDISWSRHKFTIEVSGNYMPEMLLDPPYSVEVFLRTSPYFKITVEEGPDPFVPGVVVDKNI